MASGVSPVAGPMRLQGVGVGKSPRPRLGRLERQRRFMVVDRLGLAGEAQLLLVAVIVGQEHAGDRRRRRRHRRTGAATGGEQIGQVALGIHQPAAGAAVSGPRPGASRRWALSAAGRFRHGESLIVRGGGLERHGLVFLPRLPPELGGDRAAFGERVGRAARHAPGGARATRRMARPESQRSSRSPRGYRPPSTAPPRCRRRVRPRPQRRRRTAPRREPAMALHVGGLERVGRSAPREHPEDVGGGGQQEGQTQADRRRCSSRGTVASPV